MGYRDLAFTIVKQAVMDYKQKKAQGESVRALTNFFKSDWCDFLLNSSKLTGRYILAQLESETI